MARRPTLEPASSSAYLYPEMYCARHILHKEKAAGLAPYVGDPFVYVWYIGTDELGRSVAGDAMIRYLDRPL